MTEMAVSMPSYTRSVGRWLSSMCRPCDTCGGSGNETMDSSLAVGVPGGQYPIGPCSDCDGTGRYTFALDTLRVHVVVEGGRIFLKVHQPEEADNVVVMETTRPSHLRILDLLREHPFGLTYDELWYTWPDAVDTSPAWLRNRVSEMATAGLVEDSGARRLSKLGNPAIVWVEA